MDFKGKAKWDAWNGKKVFLKNFLENYRILGNFYIGRWSCLHCPCWLTEVKIQLKRRFAQGLSLVANAPNSVPRLSSPWRTRFRLFKLITTPNHITLQFTLSHLWFSTWEQCARNCRLIYINQPFFFTWFKYKSIYIFVIFLLANREICALKSTSTQGLNLQEKIESSCLSFCVEVDKNRIETTYTTVSRQKSDRSYSLTSLKIRLR